ncbi:uncharacterized protein PV09_04882 [Verruconis gallopava]|uniref:F-box domain-containing protein n=1 Tax=Verruconis gallopava TaxID=253628 RepID=A0A0D2AY54_9PEZI|nr:uncharacterized protein PV09_04882 [Verruconis gallopava]KIW04064.1 hypothetical protein PV09_04882 [Verruconis gallopava]
MFPERIPEVDLGKRVPLWPLRDLEASEDKQAASEYESSAVRHGARVAVEDLYLEDLLSTSGDKHSPTRPTVFGERLSVAQASVLQTAELLELLLSFLPSATLWQARYVCKSWRELIETSPMLRRNLGYTSTLPPQAPTRETAIHTVFKINPVLESLNLVKTNRNLFKIADFNFPARWRTVKAAWRDLQLCEPPIQRVFLASAWLDKYLECESGLTAGMIADRVELSRVGTLSSVHTCW